MARAFALGEYLMALNPPSACWGEPKALRSYSGTGETGAVGAGGQDWRREREVAPEHVREQEELEAARAWLRHLEAGRLAGS